MHHEGCLGWEGKAQEGGIESSSVRVGGFVVFGPFFFLFNKTIPFCYIQNDVVLLYVYIIYLYIFILNSQRGREVGYPSLPCPRLSPLRGVEWRCPATSGKFLPPCTTGCEAGLAGTGPCHPPLLTTG